MSCATKQRFTSNQREFGLMVDLNNAIAKLVYFESPFSALCKRSGATFSDVLFETVDIYPARIDVDSYFTFQKYFMTDKLIFGINEYDQHKPFEDESICRFYEASFDITISVHCDHMVAILKSLPSQSNEIFGIPIQQVLVNIVGAIYIILMTTAESTDFLLCDPFHLKVLNYTLFSRFTFKKLLPFIQKNKEKYENCMYAMMECKQVGLDSCVLLLKGSMEKCPVSCLKQVKFAMKQTFGGKVLLFSVSKRKFSFHIPVMNAKKLFYILYPVERTQCQCELSFESFVYPVYWNFMNSILHGN